MPPSRSAFTLVEMVVVVAIILVLVGLIVPAANTLWNQRKFAEAENTVQGLLMTARAKAVQGATGKRGLLFFVDDSGAQRILPIRQVDVDDLMTRQLLPLVATDAAGQPIRYELLVEKVFEITDERAGTLPPPVRGVPRYAVNRDPATPSYREFSDAELGNNNFLSLAVGSDNAQRHRNYFTVVFSTEGHLLVGEDVLIMDRNDLQRAQGIGDRTGMPVGDDGTSDPIEPLVQRFYPGDHGGSGPAAPVDIDPTGLGRKLPLLVVDGNNVAINFPSVDGVMIYDDELINELPVDREKRDFLLRTGQPMFVNRLTGAVIRGPVGEVQ